MTRPRRVAAIALCVGLVVGIAGQLNGNFDLPGPIGSLRQAAGNTARGGDDTDQFASSLPEVDGQAADLAAAQGLLSARAAAVKSRNKRSWMATVDGPAFRGRQAVVFDNLMKLPLGQFSYGTVRMAPALAASRASEAETEAWAVSVTGAYSLAGFDRAPQAFDATYTLVRRAGGWRISADTDGVTPLQMWDLPGLRVLKGTSGIVIGNAPYARMREYRTIADSAVRRVTRFWGKDWSSHVVILTPSTSKQFASLLSRSTDDGLDQVAAITQGVIEPGRRAQGDRVVINPDAFTSLQPVGRRVVITHELTHVAARSSTTSPAPIWLTEGMADYIGYSGLNLSRGRVASELVAQVRAGKVPSTLPTNADFDPSRTKIAPSYSSAWLAVTRLVDLFGQAKTIAFYRAVASTTATSPETKVDPETVAARAFPASFGVTQADFLVGWRSYLRTLARS
jgi:hypothetical protein